MSNILKEIYEGRKGKNLGLNMGFPKLNQDFGGIQKGVSWAVGAEAKVGKTAYVDTLWVINPYILNPDANIHWKYYSFEIDRINKEAKYIAHFLKRDFNIDTVKHNGKIYDVCDRYILGKKVDEKNNLIKVTEDHLSKIEVIVGKYIVPLFGKYNDDGLLIQSGKIDFIEDRINPTGIRNYLVDYAKQNGKLIYQPYHIEENGVRIKKQRLIGYKPNDESLYTIVIQDHCRNMQRERGFNMKENIDKYSEYHVFLRNMFKFSFVIISHLNRSNADLERLKFMGDKIYPTAEQFKDYKLKIIFMLSL